MASSIPQRKVGAGAVAGALTIVIVWALSELAGVEVPGAVASAITTVTMFVVGYTVPEPPSAPPTA